MSGLTTKIFHSLCLYYQFCDNTKMFWSRQIVRLLFYVIIYFQEELEIYLLGIFIAECFFKIITQGFLLHPDAYLRSGWNLLDFTVVVTGYVLYCQHDVLKMNEDSFSYLILFFCFLLHIDNDDVWNQFLISICCCSTLTFFK